MRQVFLFLSLFLISFSSMAELLSCEKLRARIDSKLQAKGLQTYTLEIVPIESSENANDAATGGPGMKNNKGKEVGTCEGGTKKIIYTKGS